MIVGEPPLRGAGPRVVEVPHEGNTNASPEVAAAVAVLVITPCNAQVLAIREALASAGCPPEIRVGTVDKFILDHIPPLLGCVDFRAASNDYSWSRTDRSYARRLLDFKLQADDALHRQISKRTDHLGVDDMSPKIWVNRILQECAEERYETSRVSSATPDDSQQASNVVSNRSLILCN